MHIRMKLEQQFREKLEEIKSNRKLTELAEISGVEQSRLSRTLTKNQQLGLDKVSKVLDAMGAKVVFPDQRPEDDPVHDLCFVDLVKAKPCAGSGGLEADTTAKRKYSFHRTFIQRKGGTPESMRLFNIEGDSMEPTLRHGDMVMVNESDNQVVSDHVYLVRYENELMLKRLVKKPGGVIELCSDNKIYSSRMAAPSDESLDFAVFGRMVWSCREY